MTSNRNNAVIHDIRGSNIYFHPPCMILDFLMNLFVAWRGGNISAEAVVWITILYNLL